MSIFKNLNPQLNNNLHSKKIKIFVMLIYIPQQMGGIIDQ